MVHYRVEPAEVQYRRGIQWGMHLQPFRYPNRAVVSRNRATGVSANPKSVEFCKVMATPGKERESLVL